MLVSKLTSKDLPMVPPIWVREDVKASNPFINAGLSLLRLLSSKWFEFWNYKENENSIQF